MNEVAVPRPIHPARREAAGVFVGVALALLAVAPLAVCAMLAIGGTVLDAALYFGPLIGILTVALVASMNSTEFAPRRSRLTSGATQARTDRL